MRRALAIVLAALALLALTARPARAVTPPTMLPTLDTDLTAVGETIRYTLQASSEDEVPQDPAPGATPGFVVRGRTVMPMTMQTNFNGVVGTRRAVTATWVLEAQQAGNFKLGPASVMLGGQRWNAHPIPVRVLPRGQGPRRDPGNDPFFDPFNALDPFKNMLPRPGARDPDDDPSRALGNVTTDPRFALPVARGSLGFLHAEIDKPRAVVGEQVTLSIYYYADASLGRTPGFGEGHEADADDFVVHSLLPEKTEAKVLGYADVGGSPWLVRLVKRIALFPLKAGDLPIGSMGIDLDRRRAGDDGHRTSEPLTVHVTEPPAAGRPAGYAVGDVGRFALTADVTPREIEKDGALAVTVELSGTGNLPAALTPPARADVEWLEPQVRETMSAQGNLWGGKRTFSFILRAHKQGTIDLGELAVPFWDPDQKRYDVARAGLGKITVTAGAPAAAGSADTASAQPEALPELPPARTARAPGVASRSHYTDAPVFWLLLVASPLAWVAATGLRGTGRRLRERRALRATSPAAELKARASAAQAASKGSDAREIDAAVARVIEAATLAKAGVNMRGALGDQLVSLLRDGGVSEDAARAIGELYRECEAARFAPDAGDVAVSRARWQRAREAIDRLEARA